MNTAKVLVLAFALLGVVAGGTYDLLLMADVNEMVYSYSLEEERWCSQ